MAKFNSLGTPCAMKMTRDGKVACTTPNCRRKAVAIQRFVYRDYNPGVNCMAHYCCADPAHQQGGEIIDRNEQGYIGIAQKTYGWGNSHLVATWQERDNLAAYRIRK